MLESTYRTYRKLADKVNWSGVSNSDLFTNYLASEDNYLRDCWFAGIMCRYWGHIGRMYTQLKSSCTIEECYDAVVNAAMYVLDKKAWENEDSSLFGDKAAPDKAMHIAIKRFKGLLVASKMATKRQSEFLTQSIDEWHEKTKDAAEGLLNIATSEDGTYGKVTDLIAAGDYEGAVLLDIIAYNFDCEGKSLRADIKDLKFATYDRFKHYGADEIEFKRALKSLKSLSQKMLNIRLKQLYEKVYAR